MKEGICVVRVGTEAYKKGDTYFHGRTVRVMKKLTDYNLLSDEADAVGTLEALEGITNLHSVEDGLYIIAVCNPSYDWESGIIDGYDLKFTPCIYEDTP